MRYFMQAVTRLIKSNLNGLPNMPKLVIYESLEYCDYKKGIIYLPTLYEFAINSFYVERAPGRKREVINENTIRNALRTIKKFKGDFFKIRSVNQRIEIEMPEVRKLYESFVASNKDAGVKSGYQNTFESIINIEDKGSDKCVELSKKTPDVTAAGSPIKEYIYNKHNSNKQTACDEKSPIADNFFPSEETIQEAQSRGFLKVTDPEEISAFIAHNQDQESRWEDYNPVFLLWLERCFSHKPKQKKQVKRTIGNIKNELNLPAKKTNSVEESIRLNQEILSQYPANKHQQPNTLFPAHSCALDDIDQSVQAPFRFNIRA